MNGQDKSFFRNTNVRLPWLKIAFVALLVFLVEFILRSHPQVAEDVAEVEYVSSPMAQHVKVPERAERDLTDKKLVALTFDDGPDSFNTPRLLDILKEKNVPVTFFVLGKNVQNLSDLVLREIREGHEVESHTMTHQNLTQISEEEVIKEVEESNEVYKKLLGYEPSMIRPPYGMSDEKLQNNAKVPLMRWSVDSLDWKFMNVESILSYARKGLYDGGIILMHDTHETTVDAVPLLIDLLREDGFEFVTVSELAQIRQAKLEGGKVYNDFHL